MSANKKVLALAAVMFMGAGAVSTVEARQASLVPLGLGEVDPSWVAPAFVELAGEPLQPAAKPKATEAAKPKATTTEAAKPKVTEATPKTGGAADEDAKNDKKQEELEKKTDAAIAKAKDDAAEKEALAASDPSDSSESSGSDDDDSSGEPNLATGTDTEPVTGGLDPKKVLIKADNEEDSSSSDEQKRRTPPTELLPKGKDLQRSPEVEAREVARAKKAEDDAKIKKLNEAGKAAVKKENDKAKAEVKAAKASAKVDEDAAKANSVVVGKAADEETVSKDQKQAGLGGKVDPSGKTTVAQPTVAAVGAVSKTQEVKIVADATKAAAAATKK